jgi:hypothetical protein
MTIRPWRVLAMLAAQMLAGETRAGDFSACTQAEGDAGGARPVTPKIAAMGFRRLLALPTMMLLMALPLQSQAKTISVNGVTFSDELGGFVLEGISGRGSMDDPFVVTERMTSLAGGILEFWIDPAFGNRIGSQHEYGFAVIKVIENVTNYPWESFELELQSKLGVPSDYWDGLSFGQGSTAGRPFTARGFARVTIVDEPYDRVEFEEGKIPVGGQAMLRFVVTESQLLPNAYLAQRPVKPVAENSLQAVRRSKNG